MAKDVFSQVQGYVDRLKKQASNFVAPKVVSPVPKYQKPQLQNPFVSQIGRSPIGKAAVGLQRGAANIQRSIESPKSFQPIPQVQPFKGKSIQAGVGNFAANLPGVVGNAYISPIANLGSDFSQTVGRTIGGRGAVPYKNLKSPISRLEYNALGVQRNPQQVIGNVAGTGAELLTYGIPGQGKKLVTNAVTNLGKSGLVNTVKQGALSGAKTGALFGLLQGLSEGRIEPTMVKQFLKGGERAAEGAGAGAVLGGALSGVGYGAGAIKEKLVSAYKRINPKASQAQADQIANRFVRDELGRFSKQSKPGGKEPVFYGDLREEVGLPRHGDYRIKPGLTTEEVTRGKLSQEELIKAQDAISGLRVKTDAESTKASQDQFTISFQKAFPGSPIPKDESKAITMLQKYINTGGKPQAMSIERGLEQATGWNAGDKAKFDAALFHKDAAAIQEMLPKVPPEYQQRFANEIDDVVGKGALSAKMDQTLTPQMKAGIEAQEMIAADKNIPALGLSTKAVKSYSKDTDEYLKSLKTAQESAKSSGSGSAVSKLKSKVGELKTGLVDEQAAIEDALTSAEKKYGYQVLPKYDVRVNGIDRVLKSRELSAQFIKDKGLYDVIKDVPDENALNQYLIAKQAKDVAEKGITTGRNAIKDQQLIDELGPEYEPYAQKVTQYTKELKQYLVDSGLISAGLSKTLDKKYPNYVPLNRIFSEIDKQNLYQGGGNQVASLSSQSIVQKLKGSEREIANPLESLLVKTQDALQQGERNKTAQMLAKYKSLPGFEDLITDAKPGAKNTFSYLEDGVKKTLETTPEIAAAAKNLNREQMGLMVKILSPVTRSLQLGATGLNLPFLVTNVAKDEVTGFVNSNNAAKTSVLNPINFTKSLFAAVKHDDLYDEVVRQGGMGTSFDISRSAPETTVQSIRATRDAVSSIKYNVKSLPNLLRAVENIVGRSEELGRIKNYAGTKEALLGKGRTLEDAQMLAAQAARENTANFARKGSWGRTLNYVIPFFNAGIQGSRQLVRSFQNSPKATTAKVAVAVFMPIAAATSWNLSDPNRKSAYDDISKTEKENNILIIPPNPKKDASGKWNVIKIPLPPGLSNLGTIVRRTLEQAHGLDPVKFREVAGNLITAGTSIDVTSPTKMVSSLFPQALKIPAEGILNKNFYTGKDIVPSYMTTKPPEEQVFKDTSGTARIIGKATNTSPLKVENAVRTSLGGLGSQLINVSDRALNKAGKIPEEQIGGEGALANLKRRFSQSYGGETKRNAEALLDEYNTNKKQAIQTYLSGDLNKAKEIIKSKKLYITNKDIKSEVSTQKSKALEAYLSGDIKSAKEIIKLYKVTITNADVQKKAKSQAVSNYKKYKQTNEKYYLDAAKELISKYGVTVTNSDVQ